MHNNIYVFKICLSNLEGGGHENNSLCSILFLSPKQITGNHNNPVIICNSWLRIFNAIESINRIEDLFDPIVD